MYEKNKKAYIRKLDNAMYGTSEWNIIKQQLSPMRCLSIDVFATSYMAGQILESVSTIPGMCYCARVN